MRIIRRSVWLLVIGVWSLVMGLSGIAVAKDDVGTMVAVRNKAIIERDKKEVEAKVKDSILLKDTVVTLEASKAKMLFIDDSVLTMGEKSKVVIREFVYSKDKGGRSIFNLIDGKMRSVVGKTNFEVHTPTAVAAARGTVILFEAGIREGKGFTTIICLEGMVNIISTDPRIIGSITLTPGTIATIFEREPLPSPTQALPVEVDRLKGATTTTTSDISPAPSTPTPISPGAGQITVETPVTVVSPPIEQQPVQTTPVSIDVKFPQ